MGVGFARGNQRGSWKLIRFSGADPALTLWKKVWCFYFQHYCDVDLVAAAAAAQNGDADHDMGDGGNAASSVEDQDTVAPSWIGSRQPDVATTTLASASNHSEQDFDTDSLAEVDEETAILRLQHYEEDDNELDEEFARATGKQASASGSDANDRVPKTVLDSTSSSLDGVRMWAKARDLLFEIKRNDSQLWGDCCAQGVNNCSEKKLERHMDEVEKFFELQGSGPNTKIRGKKLRIEVGADK